MFNVQKIELGNLFFGEEEVEEKKKEMKIEKSNKE